MSQQHWIIRVQDGGNFRNSKYPFWGVKRGKNNCIKTIVNNKFKKGDIFKAAGYNKPALNQARGNVLEGGYHIQWTGPLYLK